MIRAVFSRGITSFWGEVDEHRRAEPHRLSSPASAAGAREGDPVNDEGQGMGTGGEAGRGNAGRSKCTSERLRLVHRRHRLLGPLPSALRASPGVTAVRGSRLGFAGPGASPWRAPRNGPRGHAASPLCPPYNAVGRGSGTAPPVIPGARRRRAGRGPSKRCRCRRRRRRRGGWAAEERARWSGGGAADLSRLSPGGIVYWAPFPWPFGPRRG